MVYVANLEDSKAHTYYHKHVEHCRSSGREALGYLKSPDAAYTFAFSVILLNSDQHNRKLKKRMSLKASLKAVAFGS